MYAKIKTIKACIIVAMFCSCGNNDDMSAIVSLPEYNWQGKRCANRQEVGMLADVILVAYAKTMYERSWVDDYDGLLSGGVGVCLISEPDVCSVGGYTSGPCVGGVCARKAGCAHDGGVWASETWPPMCSDRWMSEPHCVTKSSSVVYNWKDTLRHELFNYIVIKILHVWPGYGHVIYDVEKDTKDKIGVIIR